MKEKVIDIKDLIIDGVRKEWEKETISLKILELKVKKQFIEIGYAEKYFKSSYFEWDKLKTIEKAIENKKKKIEKIEIKLMKEIKERDNNIS